MEVIFRKQLYACYVCRDYQLLVLTRMQNVKQCLRNNLLFSLQHTDQLQWVFANSTVRKSWWWKVNSKKYFDKAVLQPWCPY